MCIWEHIGKALLKERIEALVKDREKSYKARKEITFDEFLNELEVEICHNISNYLPHWLPLHDDDIFVRFNVDSNSKIQSATIILFGQTMLEIEIGE
ncbi:MAG: hypothetical protein KatS3mg083_280 [Candidatus Dojkabacteria bacterium]|nr:MAG: hypothetical protein KatS3mg083_280 [Candidatus Dojkabacteria bacterium]